MVQQSEIPRKTIAIYQFGIINESERFESIFSSAKQNCSGSRLVFQTISIRAFRMNRIQKHFLVITFYCEANDAVVRFILGLLLFCTDFSFSLFVVVLCCVVFFFCDIYFAFNATRLTKSFIHIYARPNWITEQHWKLYIYVCVVNVM